MKLLFAVLVRLLIPLAILAAGGYGYSILSIEPPEEKIEAAAKQVIKTRVKSLSIVDYPVKIETNGIVGPHNPVTLSAEVTGTIRSVANAFEVGSFFEAGDLLLEMDDRDYQTALTIAREQFALAEATLELAQTAHNRTKELSRRNSASVAELDTTFAALVQARSQVEITSATIEQAQRNLSRTKIYAPFDGRVSTKLIGVGQLVSPGTLLGDVFAVDFAEVRLPIASRELRHLELPEMDGDPPVNVELRDAIDATSGKRWRGKIVRTEGTLDANSLELFAIARIEDPFALKSDASILRIGQPVVASIQGEMLHDVIAIPRSAVRRLDLVYLIDGRERTLRSLTIQPMWSDADQVIVSGSAINQHELLAMTPLVYAPEGSVVQIIPEVDAGETLAGEPPPMEATP